MIKTGKRKKRQDFMDAIAKGPILKNLPGYACKYLNHDVAHINWDTYSVFCSIRSIKKAVGLDDMYQAKAFYHLFRNKLIICRYEHPIRGGVTAGRIYTRKISRSKIPERTEIDQEIKKLCGSVSRPKNLHKLYKKVSMQKHESVNANTGKRQCKNRKVSMQKQESVNANVPKSDGTGLTDLTVKQVLTKKEQKKDLYYLKTLKDKKPNDVMPDQEIKPYFSAVSQFEDIGQTQHAQLAEVLEMNVTAETLHRSAVAFRRGQKKVNPKGPYTLWDFNTLVKIVKLEHSKAAKFLN